MSKESNEFYQMVRIAQSVMHCAIPDRRHADWLGYGVADFVASNWGTVSQDFGHGAADNIEIVERVARVVVRQLVAA